MKTNRSPSGTKDLSSLTLICRSIDYVGGSENLALLLYYALQASWAVFCFLFSCHSLSFGLSLLLSLQLTLSFPTYTDNHVEITAIWRKANQDWLWWESA